MLTKSFIIEDHLIARYESFRNSFQNTLASLSIMEKQTWKAKSDKSNKQFGDKFVKI